MSTLHYDVILNIISYIDDKTFLSHQYSLVLLSPQLEERRRQLLENRTRGRVENACSDLIADVRMFINTGNINEKRQLLLWIIEELVRSLISYKKMTMYGYIEDLLDNRYKRDIQQKTVISNLKLCVKEGRFVPSIIKEAYPVDATYRLRSFQRRFLRKNHYGVLALIY
jgi:hypothetical protein